MSERSEDALAVEATLPGGSAPTEPRAGLEYRELKGRIRSALFGSAADPVKIGRFTVLRRLGTGGMGVVYSAYDDELDRKIAIKLLRGDLFGDDAQLRLRREAQIAAKLAHPNVVGVFETGVHQGRVYVAMEFVHGRTLGAWLRAETHPWTRIVDVFLQAAQGLIAAHHAELVHRDFKPDNVMVDDDPRGTHAFGRVRVLDFGVARTNVEVDAPTDHASSTAAVAEIALTVTGAVVGTPAFMAPEQHAGETADARTDQYAFCLTLWQALYGEPPFAGDDLHALASAKAKGEIRSPSDPARVPARVKRLLLRGLSVRREDRFASMDELAVELAAARRGRRRWLLGAIAACFVGASATAWFAAHEGECAAASEKLRGVWDDDQRARTVAALRESDASGVGDAWLGLEPALDGYATEWSRAYERACAADEPDEAFALQRRLCLATQLRDLGALTTELVDTPGSIATSLARVDAWPRPDACHDREFLRAWAEDDAMRNAAAPVGSQDGLVSDFEGEPWTRFGMGWVESTDTIAGGDSEVTMEVVEGGAAGSGHAMRITGVVREHGRRWGWAGAMFMPGATAMAPANLSHKTRLSFAARGEPGTYAAMVFSLSGGWEPTIVRFDVGREWAAVEIALADLGIPLYDVTAIFVGSADEGAFELDVDDVRLDGAGP